MKFKHYDIPINTDLLAEQLYAAFPEWEPYDIGIGLKTDPFLFYHETPISEGVDVGVPDETDWSRVDAVMTAHNPAGITRRELFRNQIVQLAQSSVGVRLQDLTQAQIKSLIAVLLYKAGGVDPATLTVKPLSEWV